MMSRRKKKNEKRKPTVKFHKSSKYLMHISDKWPVETRSHVSIEAHTPHEQWVACVAISIFTATHLSAVQLNGPSLIWYVSIISLCCGSLVCFIFVVAYFHFFGSFAHNVHGFCVCILFSFMFVNEPFLPIFSCLFFVWSNSHVTLWFCIRKCP